MNPSAAAIAPRYVRLSGEIADQGIINALRAFYPTAAVAHAFASTEAGVVFEVSDGLEGFPASILGRREGVETKVADGSLRVRSDRAALRYVGGEDLSLADDEGFVDTSDMVEARGDRYFFLGRRTGVINIGGLKVHPEEVEGVINRHPDVQMSIVKSRPSRITGALVAADVVLLDSAATADRQADCKREILDMCRERLAAHKVPATLRFVSHIEVAAAGKLDRTHA